MLLQVDFYISCFLGIFPQTGELYTVACSPTDATLVATGGRDEKGFLWRIGQGNWASELQGFDMKHISLMRVS